MYTLALVLAAVGALNWGLIGIFDFNLVASIFGADTVLTNIIYIIVGLAALFLVVDHFANLTKHHSPVTRHA